MTANYSDQYRDIDFRKHPEKYRVGRGEQGVLIAEPYKSEILPHWKFKTPAIAETSAKAIYAMFKDYRQAGDFVGMDMARKFLQMGFTRSRRYANHPSGQKYQERSFSMGQDGCQEEVRATKVKASVRPQAADWQTSDKAKSADIFYSYYQKAKDDPEYLRLKAIHRDTNEGKRKPSS